MAKYVIGKRFSTFFKPRGKDRVSKLLAYAGVESNPEVWLGSRLLVMLLVGIVGVLLPISVFPMLNLKNVPLFTETGLAATIVAAFVSGAFFALLAGSLMYMHLYYLINDRTKRVDEILPDFLLMVAANLRSGMTPYAAFQSSARPEFGPLQSEIIYVSSRSLGIESFSDALRELTNTIDSTILRRMVVFFENGLKSGGKLAYLLETSAEEIRETEEIKRQMIINTKTYAIFLIFILIFGLPMLLAISTQFLSVFTKIQGNLGGDASTPIAGLSSPKLKFDVGFIDQLAIVIIVGTSLLTSVMVGVISEGKLLYGLKYTPPLAIGAMFFFWIFRTLIGGFIGSLA